MTADGTLAARAAEFEQRGYLILRGFNAKWVERWRQVFEERYRREAGEDQRGGRAGQPRAVLRGLLQERPDLFLPALVAPAMLDLLEELMGPFVGFDSLQVAVTPPVGESVARAVRAWHRDMWGLPGWTDDYLPPNAVNVLTYLQEGAEYGRLRVIPGSHRGGKLVAGGGPETAQAGEQEVDLAAGDTVVVHSSLLHSTSGNYGGGLRIFVSYFYTKCWLPKRDAYGMASMQREIRAARARGDRRVARLFEPDRELLTVRAAGDRGEYTERELWQRWRREEQTERDRGGGATPPKEAAPAGAAEVGSGQAPATAGTAATAGAVPAAVSTPVDERAGAPVGGSGGRPRPARSAGGGGAAPAAPQLELVLDARAELGEGPVWHAASGTLYWVDLFAGVVHHYQPASGLAGRVEVGEFVGCVAPRAGGGLLAAAASGIYHLDPAGGAKTRVAAVEANRPETHFNDGKVDPAGRFWFGSIAVDRTTATLGDLYSLEPDLSVTRRLRGIDNSNGMDWSPDGRTMYYVDSLTRQVTAFDYDLASGKIANPRPAVTLPEGSGVPDGMTVALDGTLWVAHWGGGCVTRWHPATGALLQTIRVPANLTTSCAFGGPALDQLYVTTARYGQSGPALAAHPHAGGVFRYQTDTRGRPAANFPG